MNRDRLDRLALLEQEQRARDDRVFVTVGRAAKMLKVTRWGVRWFELTGQLQAEVIEGVRRNQVVFRKGEIRRFLLACAERSRRRPPTYGPQLALPLRTAATSARTPIPWRLARFTPRMIRAGLRKGETGTPQVCSEDRRNPERLKRRA